MHTLLNNTLQLQISVGSGAKIKQKNVRLSNKIFGAIRKVEKM